MSKEGKEKKGKTIKIGKKTIKLKYLIIGVIVLVLIVILCCIFLGGNRVKPKYDNSGKPVYIEEDKIENIYSNASPYAGYFIDLSGQIFNILKDEDTTMIQINTDVENASGNTMIYYNGSEKFKEDDYIKVTGYIYGTEEYENLVGGTNQAPIIIATKVEKSTYKDVVSPTLKEVTYTNKKINQHGYQIEVNKVEFAKNETRVFVTAKNGAKADFSIYAYSAIATQEGKQYEQESNLDGDYEELSDELKPGITSSGIITFKAMEQKDFTFIIEGSSDNWDIDLSEYKFNLEVK